MSMHEIEAVVELSVRALSQSGRGDLRDLYKSLYDFQARWDTGYTHFRVMELLLDAHFVYRFPMSDHPEYDRYRDALDRLQQKKSEWVYRDPGSEWSKENRAVAYWEAPYLYFDAGSELWQKFIEAGKLSGADAAAPKEADILNVALIAMQCAEKAKNGKLIAWWYATAPFEMSDKSRRPISSEPNRPLRQMFEIAMRNNAPRFNKADYGSPEYPTEDAALEDVDDTEFRDFLLWWYKPVWKPQALQD